MYEAEEWAEIPGFPGYSVSNEGRVRNDYWERILTTSCNQQGIVKVGLVQNGFQRTKSVTLLVANAFLEPSANPNFDTPIQLDGNRVNNHVDNLMWRPRWFAVKFHHQFMGRRQSTRVIDKTTHHEWSSWDVVTTFGVLHYDLIQSIINNTYVFPTYQLFEFVEE